MAKASWLSVSPTSGSGNGTISNSASAYTGRVARETTVTVTGTNVSTPSTYKVTQSPKTEFVSFKNGTEMAANKTAGTLTVEGTSNSESVRFTWATGSPTDVAIPANITANGTSVANGAVLTGDPGASAEYTFSVELEIPLNDTVEEIVRTLVVTSKGGKTAQIAIKQSAGDARLVVNPETITIPQAGGSVSVDVESNTSWTVS